MIVQSEFLDTFLPHGEGLKALVNASSLTTTNLDKLLRNRGVYVDNKNQNSPIAILSASLLSPVEFDFLRAKQNHKEDKPKRSTKSIILCTDEDLINIVPSFNLNELIPSGFKNYEVSGSPNFEMNNDNPNNLTIQIPLTILDSSKNWSTSKSSYNLDINLERNIASNELIIKSISTAPETKEFKDIFVKSFINKLKQNEKISVNTKIQEIKFNSFITNRERIKFFLSLIGTDGANFIYFQDVLKVGIIPSNDTKLPEKIEWMQTTNNLMLGGDKLHKIFFIDNKEYNKHLIFYKMSAQYKFEYHAAKGDCVVLFEFPKYLQSQDVNIEFEIKISSIKPTIDYKHVPKQNIEKWLLEQLSKIKLRQFKKHLLRKEKENIPNIDN